MGEKDELIFIEDIAVSINKIIDYVYQISEKEFDKNVEKQDAVMRRIEIIGEAAKRISKTTKDENPEIPWREMAGMRDVLIHQYLAISVGMDWRVATHEIPLLKTRIEKLLKK